MKSWQRTLLGLLIVLLGPLALAAGGGGGGGMVMSDDKSLHADPDYVNAVAAIKAERWADAIESMSRHLRASERDADGHNWMGYAYRKQGRLDDALRHYKRALAINPRHLGAHEYSGEAYLLARQPDEAERHLKRLADLCGTSCEQYRDLQQALAQYREGK